MKQILLFFIFLSTMFCGVHGVSAGNLSLIEKRLIELDKLNKQVVEQAGELPENGSVEIEAKISLGEANPGDTSPSQDIATKRIDYTKKTILALDEKVPYTVQISASQSKQQCFRVAAMLRRTGYPAFTASLRLKDQRIWHRIFVGSFATAQEAEKTRQSLEADEITDTLVKNMPYAIQVGKEGTIESFRELREKLSSMHYMPYTGYVRDTQSDTTQIRLLLGAFENREDTTALVDTLRSENLEVKVVNR